MVILIVKEKILFTALLVCGILQKRYNINPQRTHSSTKFIFFICIGRMKMTPKGNKKLKRRRQRKSTEREIQRRMKTTTMSDAIS